MKTCSKCGKQTIDQARFCPSCGTPFPDPDGADSRKTENQTQTEHGGQQAPNQSQSGRQPAPDQSPYGGQPFRNQPPYGEQPFRNQSPYGEQPFRNQSPYREQPYPDQKNGRLSGKAIGAIIAGAAAAAALIIVLVILRIMPTTIDLNKYYAVKFSGYDKYGTAEVTCDDIALQKSMAKALYKKKLIKNNSAAALESWLVGRMSDVESNGLVSVGLSKKEKLSNGDKVTLSFQTEISKDAAKSLGIRFKYKDKTYTAKGLKKIETFDAFSDIAVAVSGIAPEGEAALYKKGDAASGKNASSYYEDPDTHLEYEIGGSDDDNKYGEDGSLSNGDTILVTITNDLNDYANQYGRLPKETSKKYKIEGLAEYAKKVADIPQEDLQKMDRQAQSDMAEESSDWGFWNDATLGGMKLLGYYMLTPKEGFDTDEDNRLYLVYQVTVNAKDPGEGDQASGTFYTAYYFDNISIQNGKAVFDLSDYYTTDGSDFELNGSTFDGYRSLDGLYNECVTGNASEYNAENTVKQ